VGGWGHLLGDRGSGYHIVHRSLCDTITMLDRKGRFGLFGQRALRQLQLNEPNELIAWMQGASKTEVAALAPLAFAAANEGDGVIRLLLSSFAGTLACDAMACARQLARTGKRVEFVLAGSVLLRQPAFARSVAKIIGEEWPGATVIPLARESVWGAVAMARSVAFSSGAPVRRPRRTPAPNVGAPELPLIPSTRELSPTERRNPRSMKLDELPLAEALELMWSEEATIPDALRRQRAPVEKLIRLVVRAFQSGGRLFYVGAGTSGRLGVLDASECPPTFRTPPELVQGIIAGGARALHAAVEGAEDDAAAGARAVEFRGVGRHDVVVGIAASGRTPFVWGALAAGRRRRAKTALICFNPHLVFAAGQKPDLVIAADLGPEVLTGSTRLKAGTATKLILNAVTTLAMVRLGKVIGNLMVDLNPSNVKLCDRAVRIVVELTGVPPDTARTTLEKHHWEVACAVQTLGRQRTVANS
jgi:N-acetylmuramic acid 6-phosphate etherase